MVPRKAKSKLRIIPLGGLGEIGKNMTLFEYDDDIFIVDCGLAFPEDEMLGIDLVIPDITYVLKNIQKVRGIVLTHGHEDHIGALPYVLQELNVPIYATRLTMGLVENKLKEHNLLRTTERITISQGESVKLGNNFKVEFIRSNHSIADAVMLSIWTPAGIVVHTGDFKIDFTPIIGAPIDLHRLAEIGKKRVLALMADSTNVERPGYTQSEKMVGARFEDIFASNTDKRIMIATFASNVDRVQQVVNAAHKYKRKVAVIGRSMVNVVKTASELGYITIPENTLIEINDVKRYRDDQLKLIHTLIRPKYFIPVHGEYRHLQKHTELAMELGMKRNNIVIPSIGEVIELGQDHIKVVGNVPSGQVLVDGLGVGDVGNIVLRDRKHLSQDGLLIVVMTLEKESGIVVAGPDIISRGFVYVREAENLMEEAKFVVRKALDRCEDKHIVEWSQIKTIVKDDLREFVWQKTKRSPMILPIIMEV